MTNETTSAITKHSAVGTHIILDLFGISFSILNDEQYLLNVLKNAAIAGNATILHTYAYKFQPQGVTAIVVISESHLSIHTYPEEGMAAVDIFTCGTNCDITKMMDYIIEQLEPRAIVKDVVRRLGYRDLPVFV